MRAKSCEIEVKKQVKREKQRLTVVHNKQRQRELQTLKNKFTVVYTSLEEKLTAKIGETKEDCQIETKK